MPLLMSHPEPDDFLHNPDPRQGRKLDKGGTIFTFRGLANVGCLLIIGLGFLMLLYVLPSLKSWVPSSLKIPPFF